jgi:hypothetical protein
MQVAFRVAHHYWLQCGKMFLQSMNTEMVSSQGTSLDQAIKLSSTYFDDKSKTVSYWF